MNLRTIISVNQLSVDGAVADMCDELTGRISVWQTDAKTSASAVRPAAEGSGIVNVDSVCPNNFQISVACVPHLEKVCSNLRQNIGRTSGDDMNDLDVNSLIWEMFLSATLDAAVHLGQGYLDNLHSAENQTQRTIKQLLDVTKKLITDQTEIQSFSKIDRHTDPWQRTTLLTDKAVHLSTAKVYVLSDSVLCLGKMNPYP